MIPPIKDVKQNMKDINIILYNSAYQGAWDSFITNAKNGHFFFCRKYMEYHADRFTDYSLIALDEKERIVAVLPASKHNYEIISHGGLTFGGVITDEKMTTFDMLIIFEKMMAFYKNKDIKKLLYKCIPSIYARYPADEDKYALFINNAKLIRRDVSSAIYLPRRYKYQKGRKWMIGRGKKNNIIVHESFDFKAFIALENNILQTRHETLAVHTADEISLLAKSFPENIKLYVGELNGELLAGTILFINGDVVHTQYMANSDKGRELGALDCVVDYLITKKYADYKYFDFGISNEKQGRYLNKGLIGQKEGFGARAVVHDFYELEISDVY